MYSDIIQDMDYTITLLDVEMFLDLCFQMFGHLFPFFCTLIGFKFGCDLLRDASR